MTYSWHNLTEDFFLGEHKTLQTDCRDVMNQTPMSAPVQNRCDTTNKLTTKMFKIVVTLHLIVFYLNNAIDMEAHDKFWDITHQIVEPVVNSCQNVDWFVVVSKKDRKSVV